MVTILDSGRREMVFSACGVLINILADSAYHQNVAKNGGVQKYVGLLMLACILWLIQHIIITMESLALNGEVFGECMFNVKLHGAITVPKYKIRSHACGGVI